MPKKFNIFISYRRKGGFDSAKLLYDRLRLDGYSVSFDMDTLERGNFDSELESRVKKCRDFVVVLNPGIFDRFHDPECNPKDDWVRREIACAIAEKKNIVPVILDGFQWSKNPLPPDVEDLARKNGIDFNPKYFEAMYASLKQKFLISKPSWTTRHKTKIISIFIVAFLAAGAYLYFETNKISQQKIFEIQLEKQKTDSILRYQDSIIRHRDSIPKIPASKTQAPKVPAPAPKIPTNETPALAKKQDEKNEDKALHWIGPGDAVGTAMYEKLIPAGVKKTPCSGNGININVNRPACKQANDQIMCSYLPTLTLTDCRGKLLGALKITAEFIGLQEDETAAKNELANDLRTADFSSVVSNVEKYRKQ
ncbi:MAG: TIR domain-containing protein [Fibromonadales bacterium]|nr:TIR domain-containing protein [Fibromonadales bacterium]